MNMYSIFEWLVFTLRVKTICWERLERKGIQVRNQSSNETNYSSSDQEYAYLKHYKQQAKKLDMEQIYHRFLDDAHIQHSEKNYKFHIHYHPHESPLRRFFEKEKDHWSSRQPTELSKRGANLLRKMIQLEIEEVKEFAFGDIRVSR